MGFAACEDNIYIYMFFYLHIQYTVYILCNLCPFNLASNIRPFGGIHRKYVETPHFLSALYL